MIFCSQTAMHLQQCPCFACKPTDDRAETVSIYPIDSCLHPLAQGQFGGNGGCQTSAAGNRQVSLSGIQRNQEGFFYRKSIKRSFEPGTRFTYHLIRRNYCEQPLVRKPCILIYAQGDKNLLS